MRKPALALVALLLSCIGCASIAGEPSESSADELAVERVPLPTLHTDLRAGAPYSPIVDDTPLAITGATPCLTSPRIVTSPGTTMVDASIVTTRRELMNRLDLGIEGVPINVARLAGATGTARLAIDTKLSEGTVNLMFQAKGTFETTLAELGAEPPAFDPARIDRCGWGYVKKAYHRLSAVVLVTIESHDHTNQVRVGCGANETGCTPTSIAAGPVAARAALERTLRSGSYDIAVRSVADVIPGLEPTPLGNMVALSSTPETADAVLAKLGSALDWLGRAQVAIGNRMTALAGDPMLGAPATRVDFAYWPGLSSELRERLARAYDDVVTLRGGYDRVLGRAAAWETFETARAEGYGHFYNVPSAPVGTVDDLAARGRDLLAPEGLLATRRRELEASLDRCEDAVRNDGRLTSTAELVARVQRECAPPQAASWESDYDRTYGLGRLAPRSSTVRTYDEWRDDMCPPGQRLARIEEANLLGPFSHATADEQNRGVWLRRENLLSSPVFVKRAKVDRVGLFQAPEHVALCFADRASLFE